MYKIDIEPVDKPKSRANEMLNTMMDVLENIQYVDDAGFALRMKILNNILVGGTVKNLENFQNKNQCQIWY